uniref:STAT transcription factor protein interaction domain-containing protein n=1 Tax=Arion vulgaris TaxID=1028688 RepID=A0A0B7B5N0_9EUPU
MQNMSQIRELIMQGNGDILGLYLKIPFFIREQLDGTISRTSWERVSEGCERQDKDSLELAAKVYQSLLDRADEYIQENSQEPNTKNSAMMKLEKYRMQNEFQNDAARFASEMAVCLKKENELIFTYSEAGSTTIENTSNTKDITNQNNDMELEAIEEVTKAADAYLYQAKKCIEEFDRCREIGLSFLGSYAQDAHMDEGLDEHNQEQWNGYAELQNQEMACEQLKKQLQIDKQNALAALNRAYELSLHYVDTLVNEMKAWRVALAKSSVRVGPVANYTLLINRSKRFGQCINTIFTWCLKDGNLQVIREREQTQSPDLNFSFEVGRLERDFRAILTRLLQIFETVAPKGDISIENKGKRDSPNYCTKKTQSFSTTIRVLAGECFSNFQILNTEVELVAERDLAQGSTGEVTSRNCSSCLKVETTTKSSVPEITFNIEVKNFYRVEQNNVYKQFFRLRYKVTVSINDNEYCLETLSLPFTFNTGANQILEHKGARLWYCASVQDLYSSLDQCPDPLPVDDVIKILDDRVTHLDTNSRRLTEQEKEFLKGRLPVASDGTVTMQGFLKDKMRALRTDEPLSFSFYTWFYSVIHSIEQLLLKAWQDGIIYGFCSDKNARDILMNPRIPEGTVLLRPSVSEIKRTSSADATAALVMEVKLKKDDAQLFDDHNLQYGVHSIPLLYKHIEQNTLYGAIKGIQFNNKSESAAKFLYMFGKGKKLKILKEYSKKQERKLLTEYNILIQKFQKFNIIPTTPGAPDAVVVSDEEDDNEKEPPTRKRRYRKSTSSTQRQSTLLTSAPTGMDESSGGASTLPAFSMLSSGVSSGEINQELTLQMQLQSSPAVNVQSQRYI